METPTEETTENWRRCCSGSLWQDEWHCACEKIKLDEDCD